MPYWPGRSCLYQDESKKKPINNGTAFTSVEPNNNNFSKKSHYYLTVYHYRFIQNQFSLNLMGRRYAGLLKLSIEALIERAINYYRSVKISIPRITIQFHLTNYLPGIKGCLGGFCQSVFNSMPRISGVKYAIFL